MTTANTLPPLPGINLAHLVPVEAGMPLLARLAMSGHGSAARAVIERALQGLYPSAAVFDHALQELATAGHVIISKKKYCRITPAGRKYVESRLGRLLGRDWADILSSSLAALALGLDGANDEVRQYLSRRDNMECAALARLYGIGGAEAMPSRTDLRAALLHAFVTARLPECESAFTEIPMRNTSRDPVGRAVLLGAAGLNRGTHRDAETVLLRKALGMRPEGTSSGIAEALIRGAIAKSAPHRAPVHSQAPGPSIGTKDALAAKSALQVFAATVRDLAKTQRTDPFAGRVAIAQVYDAGLARKINFGTLDEFKARIAEAGRAGLLDLERYDIAGPMDNALRERSRTAFGRDERHFIVNEWI